MRLALFALALGLFASSGCSGDHDSLAAGPPKRDAGEPRDAPIDEPAPDAGDDDAQPAPEDAGEPEEPLPFALTLVNGMPDAPAIRLCFVPVVEGVEEPLSLPPLPDDDSGLGFGRRLALASLPGISFGSTALRPYVISGDLSRAKGVTCAKLLATQIEGVHLTALPILPAVTFSEGRSALLVTTGCVGGDEGHIAEGQSLVCGADYAPDSPTASLVVVPLSRSAPDSHLGLQAAHAFTFSRPVTFEIIPAEGFASVTVTPSAQPGTISPKLPLLYDEPTFTAMASQAIAEVREVEGSSPLGRVSLGEAIGSGGLAPSEIRAGRNYTLVAVGPSPQVEKGPWWEGFTMLLIENDPL